jgi:hypothetical protein
MGWLAESPHGHRVLGWEPLNEWDSFEWTLNPEGNGEPGRETEMRRRAAWIGTLNRWLRDEDPDRLVVSSSTVRDPRGPQARALLYDRSFDVLGPHLYTNSNEEPINNPDPDRSVRPAVENALLTQYFTTHRIDRRPLLNAEWGMTRADWFFWNGIAPQYGPQFTQAEDEAIYRTVSWSGLATGQLGPDLRIAADELIPLYLSLTPAMRDVQLTLAQFLSSGSAGFDFAHFNAQPLAGRISATSPTHALMAWGSGDAESGIGYVIHDVNAPSQPGGPISNGTLRISGLEPDKPFDVELWATTGGALVASGSARISVSGSGELEIPLGTFDEDLAIKFVPESAPLPTWAAALGTVALVARRQRAARARAAAGPRRSPRPSP